MGVTVTVATTGELPLLVAVNPLIFPNPASTSIKLDDGFKGISDYQILNGQGQIVMSGKSIAGEQIQISTLAPGAYYIHWIYQNDNKVSNISRFVKTN